jgi:hypothetical protein
MAYPEVIFKAQDGTNVNARLYKPELANANKAAILFVLALVICKMPIIIE